MTTPLLKASLKIHLIKNTFTNHVFGMKVISSNSSVIFMFHGKNILICETKQFHALKRQKSKV